MRPLRVALTVATCAAFPVVLAATLIAAAADAARDLIEERHYPSLVDEAESWLATLYRSEAA